MWWLLALVFSPAWSEQAWSEQAGVQAQAVSALDRYELGEPSAQWRLPRRLREISGLAISPAGRLFAHDDERAVVYEIDFKEGKLLKAWALGDGAARGDFEGIAVARGRVWLVTSDGTLFEGPEGADDERVLFNTYGTGVGRNCEVEGLAYEPNDETLLLVCKTPRVDELRHAVGIYRWSLDERRLVGPMIRIPLADLTEPVDGDDFSPSGIERDPQTGNYVIVAARQELIAEVTPSGTVVAVKELSRRDHRQPEGIAFSSDLTLFIADEGAGRRARLTLYAPRPRVR